ncbi:hypothetical protein SERLA73DRAFT_45188 [Serpula lacrymans var. lacrymans S7.3]|uniref:Uncharacterized protein n=1 Tax=Serpula lacrymans var. lacrymans (strain S7.3) TaxID=936435 RepID=F8PFQ5_SERL3|nr:hypothetical protein SERLA73DRAFT_45188 [Serpula lacrymans var. lacrymans S7.3]
MKKLATRDFEDLLQCSIPASEGLFPPEYDQIIIILLFRFAQWHAFAKLQIHTNTMLEMLKETVRILGES